jgi:hypothetical protein
MARAWRNVGVDPEAERLRGYFATLITVPP